MVSRGARSGSELLGREPMGTSSLAHVPPQQGFGESWMVSVPHPRRRSQVDCDTGITYSHLQPPSAVLQASQGHPFLTPGGWEETQSSPILCNAHFRSPCLAESSAINNFSQGLGI